jgi:type III secretory pathway lipoprotein EscJ
MQALLQAAGIDAEIDAGADDPFTVRVPEDEVESAREALEALTEPDDLIAEP